MCVCVQALYGHRAKIDSVLESFLKLGDALTQTSDALKGVSDMYESYSELFTDESNPDVSVARL